MKLHPHLDDYWTQHGITELSYKEDSCWGIGLSIKVGLHALAEREDLVLYSYKPDALKEEGDLFVLVFEKLKVSKNLSYKKIIFCGCFLETFKAQIKHLQKYLRKRLF